MQEERTQVPELGGRHPDRREPILDEQAQEQGRIAAIVFLFSDLGPADLRRVTYPLGNTQFLEELQKPPHRVGRFQTDDDGGGNPA